MRIGDKRFTAYVDDDSRVVLDTWYYGLTRNGVDYFYLAKWGWDEKAGKKLNPVPAWCRLTSETEVFSRTKVAACRHALARVRKRAKWHRSKANQGNTHRDEALADLAGQERVLTRYIKRYGGKR